MVRFNDSHRAHTDSTYGTESNTPVRMVGITNHMQLTQDNDNQYAMTDCDHALMERFLLEMRQRSEV